DLQLQRYGSADALRGSTQGHPTAHSRGPRHRHRLHGGDSGRGPHHRVDEPTRPRRARELTVAIPAPVPAAQPVRSDRAQARIETIRLLLKRPGFVIGSLIILMWLLFALPRSAITPHDPFDDFFAGQQPPSAEHPMGTDHLGRDVLSRVMVGARDVFTVAPIAAIIGVVAGSILGLAMGYYRGPFDDVMSRIVEAFLALPVVLVALLTLVVLGSSTVVVILVVGILFTPIVART